MRRIMRYYNNIIIIFGQRWNASYILNLYSFIESMQIIQKYSKQNNRLKIKILISILSENKNNKIWIVHNSMFNINNVISHFRLKTWANFFFYMTEQTIFINN